jgi:hypothetical protein
MYYDFFVSLHEGKKGDVKENYRLRVFKNRVLGKIYGRQGDAVAGDRQKLSSGLFLLTRH